MATTTHDVIPRTNLRKLGSAFAVLVLLATNYLVSRDELVPRNVAIFMSAMLTAAVTAVLLFPSEPRKQIAAGNVFRRLGTSCA
jgi:peptidoglycan/LPS O-acetylase OafA/YrhL